MYSQAVKNTPSPSAQWRIWARTSFEMDIWDAKGAGWNLPRIPIPVENSGGQQFKFLKKYNQAHRVHRGQPEFNCIGNAKVYPFENDSYRNGWNMLKRSLEWGFQWREKKRMKYVADDMTGTRPWPFSMNRFRSDSDGPFVSLRMV